MVLFFIRAGQWREGDRAGQGKAKQGKDMRAENTNKQTRQNKEQETRGRGRDEKNKR